MGMREKLIELLITADDYEDHVCKGYTCKTCTYQGTDCTYNAKADHLIANDVVPVVRCRDCIHWDNWGSGCGGCGIEYEDQGVSKRWLENDYCSNGERREGE